MALASIETADLGPLLAGSRPCKTCCIAIYWTRLLQFPRNWTLALRIAL